MNPERLDLAREAIEVCNGPQLAVTMRLNLAVMAKFGAELLAEVDRLTLDHATEVLGLKSNAAAVRIQHDQRVELLRGTIDRLTRELAAAQQSLVEAGTEHARDLGHLADRNREVDRLAQYQRDAISYAGECKADLVRSEAKLAERTRERDDARSSDGSRGAILRVLAGMLREAADGDDTSADSDLHGDLDLLISRYRAAVRERDDALLEAACRLRDDDSWDGFQVRAMDLAAKWSAQAGDGRDKRSTTLGGCSHALLKLARLYPEATEEPQP